MPGPDKPRPSAKARDVAIDELTSVPGDLFQDLLAAADQARYRGQHYLDRANSRLRCNALDCRNRDGSIERPVSKPILASSGSALILDCLKNRHRSAPTKITLLGEDAGFEVVDPVKMYLDEAPVVLLDATPKSDALSLPVHQHSYSAISDASDTSPNTPTPKRKRKIRKLLDSPIARALKEYDISKRATTPDNVNSFSRVSALLSRRRKTRRFMIRGRTSMRYRSRRLLAKHI